MRHLIVEACIARNLLDTSAYFWPGYVSACSNQVPRNVPSQLPGWSSLMKGSPLTPPMVNALVATPATRYAPFLLSYVFLFSFLFLLCLFSTPGRVGGGVYKVGREDKCLVNMTWELII